MYRIKLNQILKIFFFFNLLFLIAYNPDKIYAQLTVPKVMGPQIIPVSPNMAALGVYGQIPVGHFTGVPDIGVPLYIVQFKELSVPISVNYHNGIGNKPDSFPGSIGLGWTLMSGGSISRVTKELQGGDLPSDEPQEMGTNPTSKQDWYKEDVLNSYLKRNIYITNDSAKYDAFYFSFNGNSGHIYFDQNNKAHIKSATSGDFSVELEILERKSIEFPVLKQSEKSDYTNSREFSKLLYKFILKDTKGVKYTFGGTDQSIDFSRSGLEPYGKLPYLNAGITPTAWQLTSIESPNGYKITLEYKRGAIIVTKSAGSDQTLSTRARPGQIPSETTKNEHLQYIQVQTSTLVNPAYLTRIITPKETIQFTGSLADKQLHYTIGSGPSLFGNRNSFISFPDVSKAVTTDRFPEKLDTIIVYDDSGIQQKKFLFNYTDNPKERLKLNSIYISGTKSSDNDPQVYKFEYNPLSLPPYLAFKSDHFGYFNNKVDVDSTKEFSHDFARYYQSREPDSVFAKAEILSKIIYPAKGYTTFKYELNQYGSEALKWPFTVAINADNIIRNTGGLRIKQITSYDSELTVASQKTYYYTKDFVAGGLSSSGVLSYKPVYYEELNGKLTPPAVNLQHPEYFTGNINVKRWNTNSLYPQSNTQGSHITYSEVAEKNLDNSFTVYHYKNYDNGYHDIPAIGYVSDHSGIKEFWKDDPGSSFDLERGQLSEEIIYNDKKKPLVKTIYKYNDDPIRLNDYIRVVKKNANSISVYENEIVSMRFTASQVFTYYPYLKNKQTVSFYGDKTITETQDFKYDTVNRLIKEEESVSSSGIKNTTTYDYPADLVSSGQTLPYLNMVHRNQKALVVSKKQLVNGVQHVELFTAYKDWTPYPNIILAEFTTRKQDDSPIDTLAKYYRYDKDGNILSMNENRGALTTYLWSYKGQYPIAKIKNSGYQEVENILGADNILAFSDSNPTDEQVKTFLMKLVKSLPNAQISVFTYLPSGSMLSSTDPKGLSTYYEYDSFQRLKYIKDQNKNILKSFCYNNAGQRGGCGISNIPLSLQKTYNFSRDKFTICNFTTSPLPIQRVTAYSPVTSDNPYAYLYADKYLKQPLETGYYVEDNSLPVAYSYIENGRIIYSSKCGQDEPLILLFTASAVDPVCAMFDLKKIGVFIKEANQRLDLGVKLYLDQAFRWLVADGFYHKGADVYIIKSGVITDIVACSITPPEPVKANSITLSFSTDLDEMCKTAIISKDYYFREDSFDTGIVLFNDMELTEPAALGYYGDGSYFYRVGLDGTVTGRAYCLQSDFPPLAKPSGKVSRKK